MECQRVIAFAHNVAAEGKGTVLYAHLSQQGCGKVGLTTNFVNNLRLFDGTSNPKHGYVASADICFGQSFRIAYAVVWQEDDKHIFPCRCLLQFVDEFADAVVYICHAVGNLIQSATLKRHNPRFVAGKGKKCGEPWIALRLTFYLLKKCVKGDSVSYALSMSGPCLAWEVGVACCFLKAVGKEISFDVLEIDVSAI